MSAEALRGRPARTRPSVLGLGDRIAGWLPPGPRRAGWWEARLWLSVSPLAFLGLRLLGRRSFVRLGRFGTVVNDPVPGRAILADPVRFRTVGPGTHGELIDRAIGPNALLNMDGPNHERLRRVLVPLLAPDAAAVIIEASAAGPIADVVERLRAGERVDLVRLIRIITGRTTFALLGAKAPVEGDAGYLATYRTGEELVAMTIRAIRHGIRPTDLARAEALTESLVAPGREGWASGEGVMGRLRELGLEFDEARALVAVIILAGTETVTSGAPRIIALLVDSGNWAALQGGPAAREAVIEEGLRLTTPSEFILRSAHEPATIGGHRFRRDERVFLSLYGMARWRRLYGDDPEQLHIGAPMPRELRHLWFGAGPHFCIGAPIARQELRRLFEALAPFERLRIVRRWPAAGVLFAAYGGLVVDAA
jgi:cytochrome P450